VLEVCKDDDYEDTTCHVCVRGVNCGRSDPEGAVLAFANMMRKGIVMPAHLVDDGVHQQRNGPAANLFTDYASVADTIGVYTTTDYANIVDHLVRLWVLYCCGCGCLFHVYTSRKEAGFQLAG
jgi:hypothetical protein